MLGRMGAAVCVRVMSVNVAVGGSFGVFMLRYMRDAVYGIFAVFGSCSE